MKRLKEKEIEDLLKNIDPDWKLDTNFITRTFILKDFKKAFAFMTEVAFLAELQDHHPNWSNVYNEVTISLSTHDAEGLTKKDFDLAGLIDSI